MRAPAPGSEDDRQLPVLHRRIEGLLDRPVEAVDLVDEEHRSRLERGQEAGDVGLALERRTRRLHERDAHLGGNDVGERGLAEPGRTRQKDVVERLAALAGGLDEDLELVGDLALTDEVGESLRPQAAVEVLLPGLDPGVGDARLTESLEPPHPAESCVPTWLEVRPRTGRLSPCRPTATQR